MICFLIWCYLRSWALGLQCHLRVAGLVLFTCAWLYMSFLLFCLFITIFIFILNYVLSVIFWISTYYKIWILLNIYCFIWNYWIIHYPACRTYEIATRSWEMVICPIYMCLTVYDFSFILFDLCLFIKIFNFILNYVLIVTFWIFTYYKIWIVLIIYCFILNYWIIYFATCLGVFWSVMR